MANVLLENGDVALLESGDALLLEEAAPIAAAFKILLENGDGILLENGTDFLLTEEGTEVVEEEEQPNRGRRTKNHALIRRQLALRDDQDIIELVTIALTFMHTCQYHRTN